jgi:hypothetical protein
MAWIEKGLNPKDEEAREEREESQRRLEDYFNGGRERRLARAGLILWQTYLPIRNGVEAFLKKREHLPEWAKHKDKIKAIRDKMESPPYPPISDEELKARREKMKAKS